MASAAINTNATTLPAQLLEVANALQARELTYNADPLNTSSPVFTAVNNCSLDADFEAKTVSITATLPMAFSIGASGEVVISATDYL